MAEPVISTSKLRWATVTAGGPEVVEPDNTHKDNGWVSAEEPPHTFFNYWMNVVYLWLVYLDGLPAEAMTWTAAHIFQAGITVTSTGTAVTATGASGAFSGVLGTAQGSGSAGNPNAGIKGAAAGANFSSGVRGDASGSSSRFAGWFKAASGAVPIHAEGGTSDFTGAEGGLAGTFTGGAGPDLGGGMEGPGGNGLDVTGGSTGGNGGASPGGWGGRFTGGSGDDGGDGVIGIGGSGGFNSGAGGRFTGGVTDNEGHGVVAVGGASAHPGASDGGFGLHVTGGLSDTGVWARAIHSVHGDWYNADGDVTVAAGDLTVSGVGTFGSIFVEAKTAVTFAGTWANTGSGSPTPCKYWKDVLGYVHIQGYVAGGTAVTVFTLPVGYRPPTYRIFPIAAALVGGGGAYTYATCIINTDGTVVVSDTTGTTQLSLDGIYFRAVA